MVSCFESLNRNKKEKCVKSIIKCSKYNVILTLIDELHQFKRRFRAQVIKQHEKYLGLPSLVGRKKQITFNDIKEKLAKKLVGWKERLLSKASKEILIKAVAQAIPTYTISCFKLPDTLCEELTSMIRNFWWAQKQDERKLNWMSGINFACLR